MKIIMDSGPTNNDIPPPTDTQVDNYTYMDDENASPSDKRKSLQSPRVPGASGYALGSSTIHIPPNPFIVDMFTSFRRGLSHYLLMEWVEGGELFSVTRRTLYVEIFL